MPYNLRNFDGRAFTTIEDGVVDRQNSSSLYLIGKDVTGYGTFQNDNFLWLLENFAGTIEPANKLQGQIWFDKTVGILKPKIYDGFEWKTLAMLTSSSAAPQNAQLGDMWFDTTNSQLHVKTTSSFALIGPEKVPGFGVTRFVSGSILDTNQSPHACMVLYVDDDILGAISYDEFNVFSQEPLYLAGITRLGRGLTLIDGASVETDTTYASQGANENITGNWKFSTGIDIGSARIAMSATNLLISIPTKEIFLNASSVIPTGTTVLGSSSNKFTKVFTSELTGGTSLSGVTLTGQFSLSNSSKFYPGADGTISLGAGNARWSTVFTRALNAGSSDASATIVGNWNLDANSVLDVTSGQFKTDAISTGDAGLPGNITGIWSLTNDSGFIFDSGTLNLGTGLLDVTNGTLKSRTLTAGSESLSGVITGQWGISSGSQLDFSLGTLKSDNLTTGNPGSSGELTGAWALTENSTFDTRSGTLYSQTLNAGDAATAGTIVGDWTLSSNSSLLLSSNSSIDARSGTLISSSLSAGSAVASGTITGIWSASAGSIVDITNGTLRTKTLSTGNSATTGTITGKWNLTTNSRLDATYADIAENYTSDQIYEPGTVVMFGGDREVTASFGTQNTKVAGIVTTEPAQILNANIEHAVAVALVGRVPCKVVGKIEKGDLLVTSHLAGVATSTSFPRTGSLIGKALEDYDSTEVGTIEVMVVRG